MILKELSAPRKDKDISTEKVYVSGTRYAIEKDKGIELLRLTS